MISPYNLKINDAGSGFYSDLDLFTNKTIAKGFELVGKYIEPFEQLQPNQKQFEANNHELIMELLMMGVLWKQYKPRLSKKAFWYRPISNYLFKVRKKYPAIKTKIDYLRGILTYTFLNQQIHKNIPVNQRLRYLIAWLSGTQEFEHEVDQLEKWNAYLAQLPLNTLEEFWDATNHFAIWFTAQSDLILGKYTQNHSTFINNNSHKYRFREDYFFSTRSATEYHLNMVFAQVMNNSLKSVFDHTVHKVVLLPTCMTLHKDRCQAVMHEGNLTCTHCSPECEVAKIDNSLRQNGQTSVLIPHTSGFTKFLQKWENTTDTGLVGVACTLNLIQGGYSMKNLHIPSQCVFLNECGCKKHWLSGETTSIDQQQLNKILAYESVG